jgi:hypothetical protein
MRKLDAKRARKALGGVDICAFIQDLVTVMTNIEGQTMALGYSVGSIVTKDKGFTHCVILIDAVL